MTPFRLGLAAGLLIAGLAAVPGFAQCAMCGTTVANSPEGRAIAGQLNAAILLMLAAPYAVFGTFVAVLFRRRLRALLVRALPGRPVPDRLAAPPAAG